MDGARKAVDRQDIPIACVTVDNPYDKSFLAPQIYQLEKCHEFDLGKESKSVIT